jgi:hypothetical protein
MPVITIVATVIGEADAIAGSVIAGTIVAGGIGIVAAIARTGITIRAIIVVAAITAGESARQEKRQEISCKSAHDPPPDVVGRRWSEYGQTASTQLEKETSRISSRWQKA